MGAYRRHSVTTEGQNQGQILGDPRQLTYPNQDLEKACYSFQARCDGLHATFTSHSLQYWQAIAPASFIGQQASM